MIFLKKKSHYCAALYGPCPPHVFGSMLAESPAGTESAGNGLNTLAKTDHH